MGRQVRPRLLMRTGRRRRGLQSRTCPAESDGDESDGEGGHEQAAPAAEGRAPNTFRFRTFAARLAAVDVDLRRKLGPLSAEPTEGAWRRESWQRHTCWWLLVHTLQLLTRFSHHARASQVNPFSRRG